MKIVKIILISILLIGGLNNIALAADTQCTELEIKLPGVGTNGIVCGPADYLAGIYKLSLGIGVFLAAVVIVMAGIKYATSGDNASNQKAALSDIYQAIFGLLILFGSVIILRTINPDLADLSKWEQLSTTEIPKTDEGARSACIECKNKANQDLGVFKETNQEYLEAKENTRPSHGVEAAQVARAKMRELENAEWDRVSSGCVQICADIPNEEI